MKTLIIEVSGGVVQEVYTDAESLRIIKVDWDAGESPGDRYEGGTLTPSSLAAMPPRTLSAVFDLIP
jgi:hypothetical protein